MKLTVNWICELSSHYNDFLFNKLEKDGKINLKVYYVHKQLKSHPWKIFNRNYDFDFFNQKTIIDWKLIFKSIFKRNEIFVIGGWYSITMILIILTRIIFNSKYVIWTDTPQIKKNIGFKNKVRNYWIKYVLKNAFSVWGTGLSATNNLKLMGASQKHTFNLPYFTDIDIFKPIEKEREKKEIVFLSSGRLTNKRKGFDLALEALGMLNIKYPAVKFSYHIAGTGPDYKLLVEQCKKYNIEELVKFVGWLDLDDLIGFYEKGDYFLHPARYEPYGVAVIEAMASGLIVVGSDVTGAVIDRVQDGVNGFIHKDNNVENLFLKLIKLTSLSNDSIDVMRKKSIEVSSEWKLEKGTKLIYQYLCVE